MATLEQLQQALKNADTAASAGDAAAANDARQIAQMIVQMQNKPKQSEYTPASDKFLENVLPAMGSGMASVGRAVGLSGLMGRFGLPSSKEEAETIDKPLMNAPGGTTGRVLGMALPLVPTAFIPGANTYAGAAAIGGGTGAIATEGGAEERLKGAAFGSAGGLAGNLLGRAIPAGIGAVKGAVEPFLRKGQERIAGRAIERFASNPAAILSAREGPSITGAIPTLAEATKDRGLATLLRAAEATPGNEAAEMIAQRAMANNAARLNALAQVAGDAQIPSRVQALSKIATPASKEVALGARSAAADASYKTARRAGVDEAAADALAPQIESLLSRPSIQRGMAGAKSLAKEEGLDISNKGSAQGLLYAKQSLDDEIARLAPKEGNMRRLLTQTSSDLKSVLDEVAPLTRQADAEFMFNSVPVNRADVGQRLLEKTTGAMRDFGGNRTLQANAFSRALNDESALIKAATGRKGAALDDFMTPSQMQRINAVRDELETVSNLSRAANGPGSQTAKMLASHDLLSRISSPLGVKSSLLETALADQVKRAPNFLIKSAEERIQEQVAKGLLDVAEGKRLVLLARQAAQKGAFDDLGLLSRAMAPGFLGYGSAQYFQ